MASIALNPVLGLARVTVPVERNEWIRLANWLLIWVVLANAGFAVMWFIGAPSRQPEILATGAIGLIVRHHPRWVQFPAFCAALVYSILGFVAGLFSLAITSLLHSLKFFAEINPSQSTEYMIAGAGITLTVLLAWVLQRRPQGFRDWRLLLLAICAVLVVEQIDRWVGRGMRGHYAREPEAGAPFTSASGLSGLTRMAGTQPRNVLIVMVESMGLPVSNPEMKRLLFARYRQPEVTGRFELSSGSTTYYNSTTAGEMRELCGRWGDYDEVLEQSDGGCLPARMRARGFETTAYHTFAGAFFHRETWYPNIGFERRIFAESLLSQGLRECGGVFPGACDRDIPHLLATRLKNADRPQFLYWLTLNSHLPVPPGANLEVDDCARISPKLAEDYPMICRQFAIWDTIDEALVREITAPDFPPTDILIVGDHMPPYFDRSHRSQFAPDKVPWLLLRWRGDPAESRAASASLAAVQANANAGG